MGCLCFYLDLETSWGSAQIWVSTTCNLTVGCPCFFFVQFLWQVFKTLYYINLAIKAGGYVSNFYIDDKSIKSILI